MKKTLKHNNKLKKIFQDMKKAYILLVSVFYVGIIYSQSQPNWFEVSDRERNYPSSVFIKEVSTGNIRSGESKSDAEARLRKEAQAYVAEAIRVQVKSEVTSQDTRTIIKSTGAADVERINSVFESAVKTSASIELTGIKTDIYTDKSDGLIYGFAYLNKYELIGYYSGFLTMNMQQLESILSTAKQLESSGEKSKARTQYEDCVPLLVKVEYAQDVLVALDPNANLQRDKTAKYRSEIIQALARLAQGVYIYVESKAEIFGKNTNVLSDKVKSILSRNGCSFTPDVSQADFILKMNGTTTKIGEPSKIVYCYAEVELELIKKQTQKTVYQERLKEKGGHTSYDNAATEAYEEVGKTIANKLLEWVK